MKFHYLVEISDESCINRRDVDMFGSFTAYASVLRLQQLLHSLIWKIGKLPPKLVYSKSAFMQIIRFDQSEVFSLIKHITLLNKYSARHQNPEKIMNAVETYIIRQLNGNFVRIQTLCYRMANLLQLKKMQFWQFNPEKLSFLKFKQF